MNAWLDDVYLFGGTEGAYYGYTQITQEDCSAKCLADQECDYVQFYKGKDCIGFKLLRLESGVEAAIRSPGDGNHIFQEKAPCQGN